MQLACQKRSASKSNGQALAQQNTTATSLQAVTEVIDSSVQINNSRFGEITLWLPSTFLKNQVSSVEPWLLKLDSTDLPAY